MYEPTYRDPQNIIFIRDELESSGFDSAESGPIFVRAMQELSPGKLRQKELPSNVDRTGGKVFKIVNANEQTPKKNASDDVQIMKLDDESHRTETYQKIGNAEVLKIEDNPIAEEISEDIVEYQDMATSPR